MSDDRLIRDLRALDRPITVDPAFADHLFERLRETRRTRRRRLPLFLLAATLLIGASLGALMIGGGGWTPTAPVRLTWTLSANDPQIRLQYAIPSELDVIASEGSTYLTFNPSSNDTYALDGQSGKPPAWARGVKIIDVAGATAHFSNGIPLGTDAASFLTGLTTHPALRADLRERSSTSLGESIVLSADLLGADPSAHLDKDGVIIELWPPSRLLVADLGDAIVLVQIWAATPEGLAEWLPDAERLVGSFELTVIP